MLQTVAFAGQRRLSARFQTAGDDNSASARRMISMSSRDGAIWRDVSSSKRIDEGPALNERTASQP
jgi:hypothetical protein